MSYASTYRIVLVAIIGALILSVALSVALGTFSMVELVIQVLVAAVAMIAVTLGRRGGSVAAVAASVLYMVLQSYDLGRSPGATASLLIFVAPILVFGLVGIAGGQVMTMLKYARSQLDADSIDDWSRLYNQRYFTRRLEEALARIDSEGGASCVLLLRLTQENSTPARQRVMARAIGQQLVSATRLADDCARLDDGSFAVLVRGRAAEKGAKLADRLRLTVARQLRLAISALNASAVSLPDRAGVFTDLFERQEAESLYAGASTE